MPLEFWQGLGHALTLAIAKQRMEGTKNKKDGFETQNMLEKWEDTVGKFQKAALLQRMPQLSVIDLAPVLHGDICVFEINHSASIDKARIACGWATEHGHTQGLAPCCLNSGKVSI